MLLAMQVNVRNKLCALMESRRAFHFVHPSSIILAGPSGAGKTTFLENAFKNQLFLPRPTRIVWVYSESPGHSVDELRKLADGGYLPRIEYRKNDDDYEQMLKKFDPNEVNMLILDDQLSNAKSNMEQFTDIFTKGSHHLNITVVTMLQNVFEKGFRTAKLNSHYVVLFKNPHSQRQSEYIGREMGTQTAKALREAFEDATQQAHSYLVIDYRQETCEELRWLTNVFSDYVTVYVPYNSRQIPTNTI